MRGESSAAVMSLAKEADSTCSIVKVRASARPAKPRQARPRQARPSRNIERLRFILVLFSMPHTEYQPEEQELRDVVPAVDQPESRTAVRELIVDTETRRDQGGTDE